MEKVSIIIATHNMGQTLPHAIESVSNQTYPNLELIVVDDGSTDQTQQLISSIDYPLTYVRRKKENKAAALNEGLSRVEGKYVALLDADDTLPVESIKLRASYLGENERITAVIGDTAYLRDNEVCGLKTATNNSNQESVARSFLERCFIPFHPMSIMYCKNYFSQVGNFNCRYDRSEDIDMVIRLLRSFPVAYVDGVVYNYNVSSHGFLGRMGRRFVGAADKVGIAAQHYPGFFELPLRVKVVKNEIRKGAYELFHPRA